MVVPLHYRKNTEQAIATYNFTDIANNTGIVRYYPAKTSSGAILAIAQIYSNDIETRSNQISHAYVLANNIDFDINFNAPRTLRGLATINVPIGFQATSSTRTHRTFASFALYKVTDGAETLIQSASSAVFTAVSTSTSSKHTKMTTTDFNISSPVLIRANDTLRLRLQQYGLETTGPVAFEASFAVAHDPKNRAGVLIADIDTNIFLDLPFRIDL